MREEIDGRSTLESLGEAVDSTLARVIRANTVLATASVERGKALEALKEAYSRLVQATNSVHAGFLRD